VLGARLLSLLKIQLYSRLVVLAVFSSGTISLIPSVYSIVYMLYNAGSERTSSGLASCAKAFGRD